MDILIQTLSDRNNLNIAEIQMLQLTFQLLLMLPVITTIVGIFRYIIGLRTISVYAPIILTFSFFQFGLEEIPVNGMFQSDPVQGLKFGVMVFLVVFASTLLMYSILKRIRMHYVPKTTLVLTGVSISLIISIFLGTYILDRKGLIYLDIIVVLMIASLGENLVSMLARKKKGAVSQIAFETLIISASAYLIISLDIVKNLVMHQSLLLIVILILINMYLGKFLGLRLSEYLRFRNIIFTDNNDNGKPSNNKKKQ